ncbi:Excinuclease ABC subunit A [Anaerobranca californiensis DSM 14826]|jgi:excinuclease ABC subunit A|uniref:UvrABC system protein A n=1 Tax=Anaerobranca californiensis DSM 14826 TaxID=1120989 RepID=A0A1M6PDT4_9FIRM|nr:excinuclease ABC subunit UvrA [Anaerobranca californiensis]SHK06125.1 Excinuclease ABC subunit A [Anaerobranca californiensis DSM 14826]
MKNIVIKGARENNLKNIDLTIPRDKLVVFTGLSGSGKSSLAFETIYAEGQRRYVESLSAYARQFLGQMEKPDVDLIEGLSPAISIDQKTTSKNPRSTVGTVTEIYDYLRLLYARVGKPYCPHCKEEIKQQTVSQMVDKVMELPPKTKIQVLAPVIRGRKGEHIKVLENLRKSGFVRVRIDDHLYELTEEIKLEKNKKHTIEVVVDRLVVKEGIQNRLADSLELALKHGEGMAIIDIVDGESITFSQNFACIQCGFSFEEISPRIFSFNNPYGACEECGGLGSHLEPDPDLIIPDPSLSIEEGAIAPWSKSSSSYYSSMLKAVAKEIGIDLKVPVMELPKDKLKTLLYGIPDKKFKIKYEDSQGELQEINALFRGLVNWIKMRYRETSSDYIKNDLEGYMSNIPCKKCNGARLKKESLAVLIGDKNIAQLTALSVVEAKSYLNKVKFTEKEMMIARMILKEINERLGFLIDVGLDYLTLDRAAGTLSGGEAQRIRLATQIGSSLMGVLYILDEPSIGLHQRDNERLLGTLKKLRDLGNTLIVVEHDEDTMKAADYIVDIGPLAGAGGGEVVAAGTLEDIMKEPRSITGQYLRGEKRIFVPQRRRVPNGKWIEIIGAKENNLKNIDVKIPCGVFTCVTGVSGSGKSTLINEILYKALAQKLHNAKAKPGAYDEILGLENIEKVIDIDQSPIGRTPRSNPATYTGVFDYIRELFASTNDAQARGYKAGRFSFNVKGGRCEACRGDGIIKIEMHFLPDVYVPCEVCKGARYNRETLEIKYKGKTIADVLDMSVEEAVHFFQNIPKIKRKLDTLYDVGLGYIKLGQSATTLSGGEAQRVKLATELSRRSNGKTLYILDEPTTGLHIADIDKLLQVLSRLTDEGSTVLVIEHNLDVIKTADYIIDLGPEGGDRGGTIVAQGTPEEIVKVAESYTGRFLKPYLK